MEHDFDGLHVGGEDDELADTSVQRLGGFVGTEMSVPVPFGAYSQNPPLLQLLVVRGLLHQIENLQYYQLGVGMDEQTLTWLVNCALARGNALGLGADILRFLSDCGRM